MKFYLSSSLQSFLQILLLVVVFVDDSYQHLPNQILKRVWTKLGYNFEMSCVSLPNRTIEYCGWNRNSETDKNSRISINYNATSTTEPVPGYTVNQAALLDGECKVKIQRVSAEDVTLWNCTALIAEHKTPYLGSVEVVLSKKPTSPEILNKECLRNILDGENGTGNSTLNVTCCTKGGVPSPELALIFNNQTVMTSGDEIGSNDCLHWGLVKFNWTDHESCIKCKAVHDEYLDADITEDFIELNILYPPKITNDAEMASLPNGSTVIHFINSTSNSTEIKSINVTYSANPVPIVDWIFPPNISTPHFNFIANIQQISKWSWAAILTLNIPNMTEGATIPFQLHISNEFGLRVLKFELIKTAGQTQLPTRPSWMWLFFIIIGAVVFQVCILCGIFTCRRNHWLCYKRRSDRMKISATVRRRKWARNNVDMELRNIRQQPPEISLPLMEINKCARPSVRGEEGWVTSTNYDWRYPRDSLQAESESEAEQVAFRQESVQIQFHATSHGFEREVNSCPPEKPFRNVWQSN